MGSARAEVDHRPVADFNSREYINIFGGSMGEGGAAPAVCSPGFSGPEEGGDSWLKLKSNLPGPETYSFFWIKLGPAVSAECNLPADLSGYDYLSLRVKGKGKVENLKLEIHEDTDGDGRYLYAQDRGGSTVLRRFSQGPLTGSWKKVVIPLRAFSGIENWDRINELVLTFEYNRVGPEGIIYIDDIVLGKGYRGYESVRPAPRQEIIRANGEEVVDGYCFPAISLLQVNGPDKQEDPTIQQVRFEFSSDGREWHSIGVDYSTDSAGYQLLWDTSGFDLPPLFSVRAGVEDISGNRAPLTAEVRNCHRGTLYDGEFLEMLSRRQFNFFRDNQNLKSGLFKDASGFSDCSVASCGFGLSALCIGVERGWIDREEGCRRALLTLGSFIPSSSSHKSLVEGKDGFFYHFVDLISGKRASQCEVSTIDTALLAVGAITAGEYFGGEVKEKAYRLYQGINWGVFLNRQKDSPHYQTFTMGWTPEDGLLPAHWDYYSDETILLNLLAVASPTHPVPPETFYRWTRGRGSYRGRPFVHSWNGALFQYQYAHAWFDFRGLADKENIDWWQNSIDATLANRRYCIDQADKYVTYGPLSWGITSFYRPGEYTMHFGSLPNGNNLALNDGTVSPHGPAGAIVFTPFYSLAALRYLYNEYPDLWGKYGLRNSFNLDQGWFAPIEYGIDAGISLLMIENLRSGLIWKTFGSSPVFHDSLRRCGFHPIPENKKKEAAPSPEIKENNGIDGWCLRAAAVGSSERIGDYLTALSRYLSPERILKPEERLKLVRSLLNQLDAVQRRGDIPAARTYLSLAPRWDALTVEILPGDRFSFLSLKMLMAAKEHLYDRVEAIFLLLSQAVKLTPGEDQLKKKRAELRRMIKSFSENGLERYSEKLRGILVENYLPAQPGEALRELDLMIDDAVDRGDLNLYGKLENRYLQILQQYFPEDKLIARLVSTGEFYAGQGRYDPAARYYQRLVDEYPDTGRRDEYLFKLGEYLARGGRSEKSMMVFRELVRGYRDSPFYGRSVGKLGKAYINEYSPDNAIIKLRELLNPISGTAEEAEVRYLIARTYLGMKMKENARRELKIILTKFPDSSRAQIAGELLRK